MLNYFKKKYQAYTLLEMAIALAVISVMLSGGLIIFSNKTEVERYNLTVERMAKIEQAIATFVDINQYIPCPSQINVLEDNSNGYFGDSITAGVFNIPSYTCGNGFLSSRTAGMVPVRSLGLDDKYAYDGWNRKFIFSIAAGMGSAASFSNNGINNIFNDDYNFNANTTNWPSNKGNISIIDLQGNEKTDILRPFPYNMGAAYVLFSAGPNGYGAYSKNASNLAAAPAVTSPEYQNYANASLSWGSYSFIQNSRTYTFDDIVVYKMKIDLLPAQKGVSPFKIPALTCSNANFAINNAVTYNTNVSPSKTLSTSLTQAIAATPNTLGQQMYLSALAIKALCDNPPLANLNLTPGGGGPSSNTTCLANPKSIQPTGLVAWYDANDPTNNGSSSYPSSGSISTWYDKSGNGRNLGIAGGSPSITYNTPFSGGPFIKAGIYYNGVSGHYNTIPNLFNGTSYTVFLITATNSYSVGTGNSWEFPFGINCGAYTDGLLHVGMKPNGSSYIYDLGQYGDDMAISSHYSNTNITKLTIATLNTGSSANAPLGRSLYVRSADNTVSTGNITSTTPLSCAGSAQIWVGEVVNIGYFNGWVGEVIVYNTALSTNEIKAIEGYLARRWLSNECP